ncbi:hypothetical protein FRB90_011544 [Tulasnella sp. 427]|nr:hypothetical protein FRB90_011544 [Tulasnella sp. 427]
MSIMKAYDTSALTRRTILQTLLLQQESLEVTIETLTDVLTDHKEIEDAIKLGKEVAAGAADVVRADDQEPEKELDMLVEEERMEEAVKKRKGRRRRQRRKQKRRRKKKGQQMGNDSKPKRTLCCLLSSRTLLLYGGFRELRMAIVSEGYYRTGY